MNRLLIVCIGNICRSPMGEAMFIRSFHSKNIQCEVASAGIGALVGSPADPSTLVLMTEKGLDVSQHRARQLQASMLKAYDLVLVMEKSHIAPVLRMSPFARGRVHCLGKWIGQDIPDPYKKPMLYFQNACDLIEKGVESWVGKF